LSAARRIVRLKLMESALPEDSEATVRLIERAAGGEAAPLEALLDRHRDRLRRMVALRMDRRMKSRLDPSDVLQEAFLEATVRLPEYAKDPSIPFFLWLRLLTGQRLQVLHRRHLGAQRRDAGREVALDAAGLPGATSAAMAAGLLGRDTRPSEAAARSERRARLQQAIDRMDPIDREVLALRHFERLTNAEAARVLGLSEGAVGVRHFRAVKRLKEILADMPGGVEGFRP
jgi:RNA polymerase sigma-70 factor (ECF subfamily)